MPGTHTAGGSTHSARPEPQRPQGTETALQPGFLRRARLRPLGCFTEMPAGSSGVQASPHGAASMVPRVGAGGGSGASRDPRTRLGGAGKVPEAHSRQPVPRVWAGSRLYKEKAPVEELQTGSSKRIKCRVWRPVNAQRRAEAAPRQSRRSVQQSWARRGRRAQGPMGCPAPLTEQGSPGEREAEGPPPRAVWRPRGGGGDGARSPGSSTHILTLSQATSQGDAQPQPEADPQAGVHAGTHGAGPAGREATQPRPCRPPLPPSWSFRMRAGPPQAGVGTLRPVHLGPVQRPRPELLGARSAVLPHPHPGARLSVGEEEARGGGSGVLGEPPGDTLPASSCLWASAGRAGSQAPCPAQGRDSHDGHATHR